MNHAIYTITAGALAFQKRFDTIANNLANVNTNGFKKQNITFSSMLPLDKAKNEYPENIKKGVFNTFPYTDIIKTDFSEGYLKHTGNKFDFAIAGKGFFMVKDANGDIKFTRNGNFTLNKDGFLVTRKGQLVLDFQYKPIRLNTANAEFINIDEKGNIYINDVAQGQVAVMDFKDYSVLERVGYTDFKINPKISPRPKPFPGQNYEIQSGYLEGSNVNVVRQMTAMIEVQRHYQATQKILTTIDTQLDGKAVNDVGRV